MSPDLVPREIVLQPGEFAFAGGRSRMRTLLGSCVAVTFWHPERRLGAMCHYLLAHRHTPKVCPPDGKYAEDVIPLIRDHFRRRRLSPGAFIVEMFGGSNMFPALSLDEVLAIGARNAHDGRVLLNQHGFRVSGADLAGTVQRMVIFELWSGDVWVRQGTDRLERFPAFRERGQPVKESS